MRPVRLEHGLQAAFSGTARHGLFAVMLVIGFAAAKALFHGIAVVDEPAAAKIRQLYQNYLDGLSLSKAAAEAGIKTYHGTAKRLMENEHYLGDSFYPAWLPADLRQEKNAHRRLDFCIYARNWPKPACVGIVG